jgi:UDP-glucose 4-epimerase
MKILVTGGAGFIGSHAVERLAIDGHEVTVFDNLSSGSRENLRLEQGSIRLVRGDVRDREVCMKLVSEMRPEAIAHLAAVASVPQSIVEPELAHEVNLDGTFNVLEAARRFGVRRFVFISSAAVYGSSPRLPSSEDDPVAPASPYAAQKAAGELLAAAYRNMWGLETVSLRLFNVFGERQRGDSSYSGVISIFIDKLRRSEPPSITGDGQQSRDFIYVSDVVSAIARCLCGDDPGPGPFNIGRGESITIRQLFSILARQLGGDDDPFFTSDRPGDVKHSRACIRRAADILQFVPQFSVEHGLARLISG